jgi:hypothetical protein
MNRKQTVKVGDLVWIAQCQHFDLPEGLSDGSQVQVLKFEARKPLKVQTEDCRVFDVDPIHIEVSQLSVPGKRRPGNRRGRGRATTIRRWIERLSHLLHPRHGLLR